MTHNRPLRSALKSLILAALLPTLATAQTYTLDHTPVQTWLTPLYGGIISDKLDYTFSDNEIAADFHIEFCYDKPNLSKFYNETYTTYYQLRCEEKMTELTLKTNSFKDKVINSIVIDALMYNASSTENQQYSIDCGENMTFTKEIPLINLTAVLDRTNPIDFQPIEFILNTKVDDTLTISITSPGANLAFKTITINYSDFDPTILPEVSMSVSQITARQIILESDTEGAVIYYSLSDKNDWTEYNPSTGIILVEQGDYTLRYKATTPDGIIESEVYEEVITVGPNTGLDAVRNAHKPITISGVVLGYESGYALVAESTDSSLDDAIAVESTNHSNLQSATIGTQISATGVHTDKFGSNIPAIGSLTELYINGTPSKPTSIVAPTAIQPRSQTYDLLGRPNVVTSRRTIVIRDRKLQLQPGRHQ